MFRVINGMQSPRIREAFVIECADNAEDASNGVLEDGDLYYLNIPEEEMLCKLRKDIVAYYME